MCESVIAQDLQDAVWIGIRFGWSEEIGLKERRPDRTSSREIQAAMFQDQQQFGVGRCVIGNGLNQRNVVVVRPIFDVFGPRPEPENCLPRTEVVPRSSPRKADQRCNQ